MYMRTHVLHISPLCIHAYEDYVATFSRTVIEQLGIQVLNWQGSTQESCPRTTVPIPSNPLCLSACVNVYTYIYIYVYTYIYICMYTKSKELCVYIHIYIYIRTYTYLTDLCIWASWKTLVEHPSKYHHSPYTCICIYIQSEDTDMCVYIYVYHMYTYIYIYMYIWRFES